MLYFVIGLDCPAMADVIPRILHTFSSLS